MHVYVCPIMHPNRDAKDSLPRNSPHTHFQKFTSFRSNCWEKWEKEKLFLSKTEKDWKNFINLQKKVSQQLVHTNFLGCICMVHFSHHYIFNFWIILRSVSCQQQIVVFCLHPCPLQFENLWLNWMVQII